MAKDTLMQVESDADKVTEIVELAIDDIELLARAFTLIGDVAEESSAPSLLTDFSTPKHLIN